MLTLSAEYFHSMQRISSCAVGALAAALLASPAEAQRRPDTHGLNVGAALNGTTFKIDDPDVGPTDRKNGMGATVSVGYNFIPMLGVFLSGTRARLTNGQDFTLDQGDVGARLSFSGKTAFVPYVEAAYTALKAKGDDPVAGETKLTGRAFTGAAGLQYFFSTKVALDLNLRFTTGEFTKIESSGNEFSLGDGLNMKSGRVNLGVAWYPLAVRRND